jgi:hypothetical protein
MAQLLRGVGKMSPYGAAAVGAAACMAVGCYLVEPEPDPEQPPQPPPELKPLSADAYESAPARRLIRPAEVDMRAPEAQIRAEIPADPRGAAGDAHAHAGAAEPRLRGALRRDGGARARTPRDGGHE